MHVGLFGPAVKERTGRMVRAIVDYSFQRPCGRFVSTPNLNDMK
jgi:hypothetical protein